MALALLAFLPIVGFRPGAFGPAEIGPKMHRAAKILVAGASEVDLVELTGLVAYRCSAGIALQGLGILEAGKKGISPIICVSLISRVAPIALLSGCPWAQEGASASGVNRRGGSPRQSLA